MGRPQDGRAHPPRGGGGSIVARTYRKADGLVDDTVYAVHESRDGTVWAGTLGSGASRFRDGRFTTVDAQSGLCRTPSSRSADTADGTTWFATPSGLSGLSPRALAQLHGARRAALRRRELPARKIPRARSGSAPATDWPCWMRTGSGCRAGFRCPFTSEIFGLAEDRQGWLWIATSARVLSANREQLLDPRVGRAELAEYGLSDGLHSTERRAPAPIRRRRPLRPDLVLDGPGLSVVDPARRAGRPCLARGAHRGRLRGRQPDRTRSGARAPPGPHRVTFGYSGVSLAAPDQIRFRYRLDGFDHGWSEPVAAREAVYTNLAPGSYRVPGDGLEQRGRLERRGSDGRRRHRAASSGRRGGSVSRARSLVALVLARPLSPAAHRLTRQLNVRFEERLAERTRIAQELHDTLLQGFLSASMQLHLAVDRMPESAPERGSLAGVSRWSVA